MSVHHKYIKRKYKQNRAYRACQIDIKMMLQQVHEDSWEEDELLQTALQSDCKICYLEMDEARHYPMLACSAQHVICYSCFSKLTKEEFLQCPFCKRKTCIDDVLKFKYALTAISKYNALKKKYLSLLDKAKNGNKNSANVEYSLVLTEMEKSLGEVKDKLKQSQHRNNQLTAQMKEEKERYTAFEREIIECKHNDIVIRNRLTMLDYELKRAQKDKSTLASQLLELRKEVTWKALHFANMKEHSEQLQRELELLKNSQKELSKNIDSDQADKLLPEAQKQMESNLQEMSPQIFLTKKKSKSQHRMKTESNSQQQTIPLASKKTISFRRQDKSRPKDSNLNVEKKIHKTYRL